jgi:gas vesicle protein
MKPFLAGLGIGFGVGLLLAPLSGEETRGRIAERAHDLAGSARDLLEQGRERVRGKVSRVRRKAEDQEREESTGTDNIREF